MASGTTTSGTTASDKTAARQVLHFWLGSFDREWPEASVSKRWFNSTKKDDAEIAASFGTLVDEAIEGGLSEWQEQADSCLALILLLDQFPRNMFRSTARAFAGDERAAALAASGVDQHMELDLPWAGQVFFYMPLMHAEDERLQARCVACFTGLQQRVPVSLKQQISNNLKFAREHHAIIQRFGRFPHRNQVLGRDGTPEELAFLEHANRYGQ
jgi:uncharacterized protein (DUF924 family)